jgi:hypothetical protein
MLTDIIDAFQASGAALGLAEKAFAEKQASEKRYSDGIPAAVNACVQYGRIDNTDEEKQALANLLATPEGALDIITKMAAQEVSAPSSLGTQEVDSKGRVVTGQQKKASYNYVGARNEDSESWNNFTSNLGIG